MSRNELKGYIRRNGLDIKVMKSYTEEDIIDAIEQEMKLKAQVAEGQAEEEEEEEEEEEVPTRSSRRRGSSRLAELEEDED